MKTLLVSLEFISAAGLIITVLLHAPKGEGLGAIGGSARMFKSQKGLEAGLNKVTTALAITFMVTAFLLGTLF